MINTNGLAASYSKLRFTSIGVVCILDWPKETMLLQFVSIEVDTQQLINAEVYKWQQTGVRIIYRHELKSTTYNTGNLKLAMKCDYVKDYEFVAIFDTDFQPTPDFLKKTVPYFKKLLFIRRNHNGIRNVLQREVSTKRNHEDMKLTSNPTATMAARQAMRIARLAVTKGSCDEDDEQQD
ncbi:hypothetical protein JHK82_055332 [Glycine max]|nr:hypothetical protein JHK82_055332 [Glycine max]